MRLPAANAQNVRRYLEISICGWLLVIVFLGLAHGSGQVTGLYLAAIILSVLVCMVCGLALIVGVYRRSNAMRSADDSFDGVVVASRRYANQNGTGALLMFAGAIFEWTHSMFGVREFTGEWLFVLLCFGAGLLIQLHSAAKYLQALG